MERRELIGRVHDAGDRRVLRVYPTRRAKTLRPAIEAIWKAAETELLAELPAADARLLTRVLGKVDRAAR
jgi:DNA-binding MarR family transcriptional regulator